MACNQVKCEYSVCITNHFFACTIYIHACVASLNHRLNHLQPCDQTTITQTTGSHSHMDTITEAKTHGSMAKKLNKGTVSREYDGCIMCDIKKALLPKSCTVLEQLKC